MSKITEFAASMAAHQELQAKAVDGLVKDVAALRKKIEELQNTTGPITPEDQKLLDDIEKQAVVITQRLGALDDLNEEVPMLPESAAKAPHPDDA